MKITDLVVTINKNIKACVWPVLTEDDFASLVKDAGNAATWLILTNMGAFCMTVTYEQPAESPQEKLEAACHAANVLLSPFQGNTILFVKPLTQVKVMQISPSEMLFVTSPLLPIPADSASEWSVKVVLKNGYAQHLNPHFMAVPMHQPHLHGQAGAMYPHPGYQQHRFNIPGEERDIETV